MTSSYERPLFTISMSQTLLSTYILLFFINSTSHHIPLDIFLHPFYSFPFASIMPPYLDPLSAALAKQFSTQPPIEKLSVAEFRTVFDTLQHVESPIPGVTRTSFSVPFEGGVKAYIFKADDVVDADKLGVVLYLHGGAFIAGK